MAVKNKMLLNLIIDNEGTAKKKKKLVIWSRRGMGGNHGMFSHYSLGSFRMPHLGVSMNKNEN